MSVTYLKHTKNSNLLHLRYITLGAIYIVFCHENNKGTTLIKIPHVGIIKIEGFYINNLQMKIL